MKKIIKKIKKKMANFSFYKKIKKKITSLYFYKKIKYPNFKKAHEFAYYYETEELRENYIFYSSQCGKSWNGNPRAILDYLLKNEKFKNFQHIILYNNIQDDEVLKYKAKYKNITFIKTSSKLYAKYAESCKYLIADNTLSPYFIKKEGQIYINSWQSTLLKPLGKDTGLIWESDNISKNCLQIDYFITPNQFTSDLFFKAYYTDKLFQGEIINVGYPRNDVIYNCDKDTVRRKLNIAKDQKIVVYAPTWRGTISNIEKSATELLQQFYKIKEALDEKYTILFKPHLMTYKYLTEEEKKLVVPDNIETNELLAVTDILITDYSGIFFDFLNTKKPIILYPFDFENYLNNRQASSSFYLDLNDIPGPVCYNINDLITAIKDIDNMSKKYSKKYEDFVNKFVPHDDGKATERVVNTIFNNNLKKTNRDSRKKILICPGNLNGNGVTESFLTLLDNIDYKKYNVSVLLENKTKNTETQLRINSNVNIFYRSYYFMYRNCLEHFWVYIITKFGKKKFFPLPKKFCIRNIKSRLYDIDFDTIIEYHGYNPMNAMLYSIGTNSKSKKYIYLHADMNLDRITKNKKIESVFTFYQYYNKLICVSKGSYEANLESTKNHILKKYKIDLTEKFCYVYNLVNLEKIKEGLKKEIVNFKGSNYFHNEEQPSNIISLIKLPQSSEIAFISIGRLSPEKNHKLIIKAFSNIIKEYSNAKLYIVGEGPLKASLDKLIIKLNIQDKVILTGYLKNPYFLLSKCNCFVFPSSYEGMGLAALEASILNKYVIASNIKGLSDFINSNNGELIEITEEALTKSLSDFIKYQKKPIPIDGKKFNEEALKLFYNIIEN